MKGEGVLLLPPQVTGKIEIRSSDYYRDILTYQFLSNTKLINNKKKMVDEKKCLAD